MLVGRSGVYPGWDTVAVYGFSLVAAAWVFRDASIRLWGDTWVSRRVFWTVATALIPLIGLLLYLTERPERFRTPPTDEREKDVVRPLVTPVAALRVSQRLEGTEELSRSERRLVDGVDELLDQLEPTRLADVAISRPDRDTLRVVFAHDDGLNEIRITVEEAGIIVSFLPDHYHFYPRDHERGLIWPVGDDDHVEAALELTDLLLRGKVEYQRQSGRRGDVLLVREDGSRERLWRGLEHPGTPETWRASFV